ncbi:MAG: PAS domain-containing protein [Bryobacteraceae bacterium]
MRRPDPTGVERFFQDEEIIVSKTDPRGIITYANEVFIRVAGYREDQLLGKPHNLIRHPDMPRSVFHLLWQRIKAGHEIFAYVKNMASNGDHYWVHAHVTPTFDRMGTITGYHSNRRVPGRKAVETAEAIYAQLLAEERRQPPGKAITAGVALLEQVLAKAGVSYDEFVFSLAPEEEDATLAAIGEA